MDQVEEMHALDSYASQKKGNVSEHSIREKDDRDRINLAKVGKRQVLKVCNFPPRVPELCPHLIKRRFGLMSMTGFSCGLMCTWEAMLV